MGFADYREALKAAGLKVTDSQIRHAIARGRISRPKVNAGLSFVFDESHVAQAVEYWRRLARERAESAGLA